MSHVADKDFQQRMQRVEGLLEKIEQTADSATRDATREVVQCLLDLHGVGLATMLEYVAQASAAGPMLIDAFAADPLVANLLLLHGLHPLDEETRIRAALDKVRPFLHSHKGDVEFLSVSQGIVRLRLQGNCDGCASSTETMKRVIEEAVFAAVPDVIAVEVEGVSSGGIGVTGRFALPLV